MFVDFDWINALQTSPIMLVLIGCSMISLAVAIERIMYYRRRYADPDRAFERSLEALKSGDLAGAVRICEDCRHPLGAVAPEILSDPGASQQDSEERLQILLSQQKLLLERNVGLLGTMAAIAPLIGLLGTVWGIMRAFHDMSQTGSAAPAIVAGGVAEALLTTALGLIVAVPSMMLFNTFNRRMTVMLTVAENHTRTLRNRLAAMLSDVGDTAVATPRQSQTQAARTERERIAAEAREVADKLAV